MATLSASLISANKICSVPIFSYPKRSACTLASSKTDWAFLEYPSFYIFFNQQIVLVSLKDISCINLVDDIIKTRIITIGNKSVKKIRSSFVAFFGALETSMAQIRIILPI